MLSDQYFHYEKLAIPMVSKRSFLHVLNDSRWFRTFLSTSMNIECFLQSSNFLLLLSLVIFKSWNILLKLSLLLHICCAAHLLQICCISATHPLHIRCISAVHPLHICCISAAYPLHICHISVAYLPHISQNGNIGLIAFFLILCSSVIMH